MNLAFFASPTVTRYMARRFLMASLAVLAALVFILMTLDLLGESGQILAHPGNGNAELWRYASLRVPQLVQRFMPFSVLLGTLITLAAMNQNSEIIAMKAAGISAHQILAPLIAASLGIAVASFVFSDRVVARATATLSAWQAVEYGPVPADRGVAANVWVRDGDDLIHADTASGKGAATRLTGITVYDRTGGILNAIFSAAHGARAGDGWRIFPVQRFDVAHGRVTRAAGVVVARGVSADRFTLADVDADARSFGALRDAIASLRSAGRPVGPLQAGLWHKLSGALSAALMPLLAGVAAFGLARSGALFVRVVVGMALGFAYFVADNFALAMGNFGAYPPLLAAWGPFLLFLLIGEAVLIRTEE